MAYVNVKDWSVDQVTDWLKGLDNVILQYNTSFLNNGVTGHQLLNLRADDLEHLGVRTLGHQEIVLEAVEHLRNFHYELDKENLQTLALRLSCVANSLFKELLLIDEDCPVVQTQVMSDVHNIITTIKPLVFWLERSPFAGDKDYIDTKINLLQLGFEMATSAHRGIFSEKPVRTIRKICEKLAKIADHIIQEMMDPMILQPASLDLATLKKKEQELGFFILPNNHAIHQIADIKHGSPAHGSSKIEEGDEIVQVNYQTVVGWQRKKVMMLLQESPPEIVLTLKKRPRHTKVYGQIYMKPYRLPSRKRSGQTWSTRWNDSIPSPRLLPIFDLPPITITRIDDVVDIPDVETELSSSDSEPPDSPSDSSIRMYPNKPRPILQRRNTITGATPTSKRPYPSLDQYWEFIKSRAANPHSSSYNINSTKFEEDTKFLRDKSTSCNVGLDLSPRPTTVIGLSHSNSASGRKTSKDRSNQKRVNFEEECESLKQKKEEKSPAISFLEQSNLDENKSVSINSLASLNNENITFIDEGRELTDRTSMALDWKKEIVEEIIDAIKMKPIEEQNENKISNTTVNRRNSVKSNLEDINCDLGDNKTNFNSIDIKSDSGGNKSNSLKSSPGDIRSEAGVNRSNSVKSNLGELDNRSNSILKKDPILSEINVHSIIKIFDEQKPKPHVLPRSVLKKPPEVPQKPEGKIRPAVPPRSATTKLKGRLDKSHSTPAYDLTEEVGENVPETPLSMEESADELAMPNLETLSLTPQETVIVEESLVKSTIKIEEAGVDGSIKLEASISEVAVKEEVSVVEDKTIDVPPKPPPRNIVGAPKPVYPADSPKPVSFIESTQANRNEAVPTRSIFEFPEFKQTEPSNSCDSLDDGLPPKYFDPKLISTPVTKSKLNVETDAMMHKPGPSYEMPKITTSEKKVSPTNSIVKAMISGKGKSGKKKNTLTTKRRKVSVSELIPATIQGYLYQRLRSKHNQNVHWEKRWFVLLGHSLYGFKTKEDSKAACLIFLSGFTVAVANEVKSRSNAFKVYHTGTVFYFSADDPDALQSWIDLIRTATLHNETSKYQDTGLYSETDESDTERTKLSDEKSDSLKKFGSLKKFSSKKSQNDPHHSGSTSLDRKWFFNKSSSQPKHSLPVPTPQFRSYRKIRAADLESSVTTGNFTSHVPLFAPQSLTYSQNVSVPNLMVEITKHEEIAQQKQKTKPINYVHASNPSLYSVNDFSIPPTFKKNQFKPCNENLAGFVTLEELMIKQTEERKLNPHHIVEAVAVNLQSIQPDVVYGEVPIRPKNSDIPPDLPPDNVTKAKRNSASSSSEKHDSSSSCFGKRLGSLKKNKSNDFENKTATYPKTTKVCEQKVNRSLPRAHKLQEVPLKHEACTLLYASDRILSTDQKKRSYEMIYCPETVNDVQFALNRALDGTMCHDTPKKNSKLKKQHSFSSADKKSKFSEKAQESFSSKFKLKSATQYTPMSLPLSQDSNTKPKFAFELNLDEKTHKGGKLKQMFGGKSEGKKEKTFLGSPKLHRAIFKKHNSGSDLSWSSSTSPQQTSISQSTYSLEDSPPVISEPFSIISPHTDYPGMEYPPVFEPETYSLADPQSSLSLLRKQGKNTP